MSRTSAARPPPWDGRGPPRTGRALPTSVCWSPPDRPPAISPRGPRPAPPNSSGDCRTPPPRRSRPILTASRPASRSDTGMNQSRPELPAPLPASVLGDGTQRYDVVVIGFGIAGGSAALEAARAGARVLLLERAAVHGGTTCMAGGHFYLGGGTAVQRATGHEDSAEEMYKYLVAASKEPEYDKIRAYCAGSVEHFGWLESLGFEFERSFFPGKAVIQPGTEGLMFTGNEKVWPFRDQAKPAPRGHKVPVPGDTGGAKLVIDLLRDRRGRPGDRQLRRRRGAGLAFIR